MGGVVLLSRDEYDVGMQTNNQSMPALLEAVREGRYAVPLFQRPFVWTRNQTYSLLDSICRNYPIGSLLVLENGDGIEFKYRSLANVPLADEDPSEHEEEESVVPLYFVLDGQQRLTSLAHLLLNASREIEYFVDLDKMHRAFIDCESDEPNWIVYRKRSSTKGGQSKGKLLRTDEIMERESCEIVVRKYYDTKAMKERHGEEDLLKYSARVNGRFEVIRNFQVPIVSLEASQPLEAVCRIFETINSTGMRLTTFDLAVAKFYPEPELRSLWEMTEEKYESIRESELEGERVLQVISLMNIGSSATRKEATRSALLALENEQVSAGWALATHCIDSVLCWLSEAAGVSLSPRCRAKLRLLRSLQRWRVEC